MPFVYQRTIRFADTDAAGVVYFTNVLSICHEAYEAALVAAGIDLKRFFQSRELAVPIVHTEADYFQPMFCGERYEITVEPTVLSPDRFRLNYQLYRSLENQAIAPERLVGRAATVHVCLDIQTRQRHPFSSELAEWLAAMPSNPEIS
jgi:1,4-dihydroxy-2-naphthoyl-CoA hydrolase